MLEKSRLHFDGSVYIILESLSDLLKAKIITQYWLFIDLSVLAFITASNSTYSINLKSTRCFF